MAQTDPVASEARSVRAVRLGTKTIFFALADDPGAAAKLADAVARSRPSWGPFYVANVVYFARGGSIDPLLRSHIVGCLG